MEGNTRSPRSSFKVDATGPSTTTPELQTAETPAAGRSSLKPYSSPSSHGAPGKPGLSDHAQSGEQSVDEPPVASDPRHLGSVSRRQTISDQTFSSLSSSTSRPWPNRFSTSHSIASLRLPAQQSGSFDDLIDNTLIFSDDVLEHKYSVYFLQHTLRFWRNSIIAMLIISCVQLAITVCIKVDNSAAYMAVVVQRGTQSVSDLLKMCPPGIWCIECPPAQHICSPYDPFADVIVSIIGLLAPMAGCLVVTYQLRKETLSKWIHVLSLICVSALAVNLLIVDRAHVWTSPDRNGLRYTTWVYGPLFLLRIKFRWMIFFAPLLALVFVMKEALQVDDVANSSMSCASVIALGILACFLAHESESSFRYRFMQKRHYSKQAGKLIDQLKRLRKTYMHQVADFDSPLEKSIAGLRSLMSDPTVTQSQMNVLENILQMLTNSGNILLPDLEGQVEGGQVKMSAEQEAWLFSELAQRKNRPRVANRRRSITFVDTLASNEPGSPASMAIKLKRGSPITQVSPRKASTMLPLLMPSMVEQPGERHATAAAAGEGDAPGVSAADLVTRMSREIELRQKLGPSPRSSVSLADTPLIFTDAVMELLARVEEWDWPIFDFARETKGCTLSVLSCYLFEKRQFVSRFSIPAETLTRFLMTVENGYRNTLPFHNAIHAADVLHAVSRLSSSQSVAQFTSDLDLLALYFAAIVHDLDHGGVNNNFLVSTSDVKALIYNDRSVLENHHVATAFAILRHEKCDFLVHMNRTEYALFRELVIDLVLATDLTQHFTVVSSFKNKVSVAASYNPVAIREDRALCWKMIMKCGDVSNPSKEWSLYLMWTNKVIQEFFNQGDREKEMQLKVSPFMDRNNFNLTVNQIGFIDFICLPLYENFDIFANIGMPMDNLRKNRCTWDDIKLQEDAGARPINTLLTVDTTKMSAATTNIAPPDSSSNAPADDDTKAATAGRKDTPSA